METEIEQARRQAGQKSKIDRLIEAPVSKSPNQLSKEELAIILED